MCAALCVTRFFKALFASTSLDDLDQGSEMGKPVTLLSNFFSLQGCLSKWQRCSVVP